MNPSFRLSILGVAALVLALPAGPASAAPVPGMSFWLDATNVDGTNNSSLSNGSAIAQWNDLSGSGFNVTQATAAKQPTLQNNVLNGLPVVRLDGVNDDLANATLTPFTGNQHTIFVVLQGIKPGVERDFLDAGPAGTASYLANYTDANGIHIFRGSGGGDVANTNYTNGQYLLFTAIYNGGVANGSSVTINNSNTATGTIAAISNSTNVYVGSNVGGVDSFYLGDMAEILVYNSVLNQGDIIANTAYLNAKWNVVPEPASLGVLMLTAPVLIRRRSRGA